MWRLLQVGLGLLVLILPTKGTRTYKKISPTMIFHFYCAWYTLGLLSPIYSPLLYFCFSHGIFHSASSIYLLKSRCICSILIRDFSFCFAYFIIICTFIYTSKRLLLVLSNWNKYVSLYFLMYCCEIGQKSVFSLYNSCTVLVDHCHEWPVIISVSEICTSLSLLMLFGFFLFLISSLSSLG